MGSRYQHTLPGPGGANWPMLWAEKRERIGISSIRVAADVSAKLGGRASARRIRLVAYGARLESVLGASPRGFESPILRQK